MLINNQIDEISLEVAKELGLSEDDIRIINRVQWRFLMETIQSGESKAVQLIYLGKFLESKKYKNDKRFISNVTGIPKEDI